MLDPKQFDISAELPMFAIPVENLSFCGINTGPTEIPVSYDQNWRPLLHLGKFLSSNNAEVWKHFTDAPANIRLSQDHQDTEIILSKLSFTPFENEADVEARLSREPLVIRKGDTATGFRAVLLSGPELHGQRIILCDAGLSEFRISSPKNQKDGSLLVTSNLQFTADDPLRPLQTLITFLTFVKGCHCGIGNLIAESEDGSDAFHLIGFTRNDMLKPPTNWFDIEVLQRLPDIFSLFSSAMSEPITERAIKQTIEFYRASTVSRPVSLEMAIIATHSGLEAIVNYTLIYRAGWSETLADKSNIRFSDKIRAASVFLGIKDDLLRHSPELAKIGKNRKLDAYEIISFFRNKIVHQDPKFSPSGLQLHEAWLLSQWLLENLIFGIIGFSGTIIDRRVYSGWRGTTSQTPYRNS